MAFSHIEVKSIPLCHPPTVLCWMIILTSALFSNRRHHSGCQLCSLEPLRKDMRISLVDHVHLRGSVYLLFPTPAAHQSNNHTANTLTQNACTCKSWDFFPQIKCTQISSTNNPSLKVPCHVIPFTHFQFKQIAWTYLKVEANLISSLTLVKN